MTKLIINKGIDQREEFIPKPIHFTYRVDGIGNLGNTRHGSNDPLFQPSSYKNVELIAKRTPGNYDIMYVWNEDRNEGVLFLGSWNDGTL